MIIYKPYCFRMYPDKKEQIKLNQFLGSSRFIYNYYLDKKKTRWEEAKLDYSLKDMKEDVKYLSNTYPWLSEVDSTILRTTLDDLDKAYSNFYHGSGYPKFKSRNSKNSYRTSAIRSSYKGKDYCNISIDLNNHTIKLPKLDEIKIKGYRNLSNFNKKIINATVTKVANRYYVSVLVEETIYPKEFILNSSVGIDIGIKNTITTSDGKKYEAMPSIKKYEYRIKKLNQALSRSQKGSNNRKKIIMKLQRVYQKSHEVAISDK